MPAAIKVRMILVVTPRMHDRTVVGQEQVTGLQHEFERDARSVCQPLNSLPRRVRRGFVAHIPEIDCALNNLWDVIAVDR